MVTKPSITQSMGTHYSSHFLVTHPDANEGIMHALMKSWRNHCTLFESTVDRNTMVGWGIRVSLHILVLSVYSIQCYRRIRKVNRFENSIPLEQLMALPEIVQECGCAACGCFLCSQGCNFWHLYAKPISEQS
ncbi:unnamed protein product [Bursaphelenchus xylophilus]|uniref:(pine wood nematode) hypothetical protein n=1 Tax=Bursaphelenchus xylophilus TaxID=6326 RepID=A0A1I7SUZ5_BURXY|nr:unnamed protein product [Bursaphelenchus xylophilus]CAG9100658.1 unnamed protein product [Bursaphelenchus xylophilus]